MEEIRKTESERVSDHEYNPEKGKPSSNKLKHKIIHFDWTIRLIRQFICIQITWVALKLFKNPVTVKKNNGAKKT